MSTDHEVWFGRRWQPARITERLANGAVRAVVPGSGTDRDMRFRPSEVRAMADQTDRDAVTAVLAAHEWSDWWCSCGFQDDNADGENAHLADVLTTMLAQARAEAWDAGAAKASPHGGAYLRSLYAENPYRAAVAEQRALEGA